MEEVHCGARSRLVLSLSMKTTYDPRPAPLGWFGRLAETGVALILEFLLEVLPRPRR